MLDARETGSYPSTTAPPATRATQIDRSQLSLLTTSLALSTIRDQYLRGHGLCIHHAMRTSDGEAA